MTTASFEALLAPKRRVLPWVLTIGIFGLAAVLLYRGLDFYQLDLEHRVEHEDYRVLAPGGLWGHGYGIVGTALILTNLLYLVRRRYARLRVGSMKAWLDMHVFTGLAGGMLVLFHSAFQARTDVALVSAVSLSVVILTGVFGRFLHFLAPAPDPILIATHIQALDAVLPGAGARARNALNGVKPTPDDGHSSLLTTIGRMPMWMREASAAKRAILEATHDDVVADPHLEIAFRQSERALASLAAREVRTVALSAVLRTWRGLHRLLAILMVLTVPAHIAIAWLYGYRWIWSE